MSNFGYKDAESSFIINDDPDLIRLEIPLPVCPDIRKIDGYGLKCADQKFRYVEIPLRLKKLEDEVRYDFSSKYRRGNILIDIASYKTITCRDVVEEIWARLNKYKDDYLIEIEWIKRQWYYLLNGYWFFNNGVPTYIIGSHYFYLNYFRLDVGRPQYRDRDRLS